MGMKYRSGKTYNHSIGLSCAFRQWKATSHCRFLHGYSLKVELSFVAEELDDRNWVVDFGSLKPLKNWLEEQFDHTTLVGEDDPAISIFKELEIAGLVQLRIVPATGCEAMAQLIYDRALSWLIRENLSRRVTLEEVKVCEHDGNWASYGF